MKLPELLEVFAQQQFEVSCMNFANAFQDYRELCFDNINPQNQRSNNAHWYPETYWKYK